MSILLIVLTSAVVGALVSSLMTLFGQYLERRSRREELVLSKAMELADQRIRTVLEVRKVTGRGIILPAHIVLVRAYYEELKWLIKKSKLPDKMEKEFQQFVMHVDQEMFPREGNKQEDIEK